MADTLSIAEAKDRLPRVIHDVEAGKTIRLTRRGKPVAVILSIVEYERGAGRVPSFAEAVDVIRREFRLDEEGMEPGDFLMPRDRSSGREVEL
jgi:prevent-host-death family protein